jgi:CheY-like chemotaxis protein
MVIIDVDVADDTIINFIDSIDKNQLLLLANITSRDIIKKFSISHDNVLYKPLVPSKLVETLKTRTKHIETDIQAKKTTLSAKSTFSGNILVVEDNIINQKLVVNILKGIGLDVEVANNGLEGFEKRKNNSYDLIFMDIQMPIMDGVEATHEILEYEEEESVPHVPIVALTANALQGDRERFLSEGLDEYVSKPIKMTELLYILNKFLSDRLTVQVSETNDEEISSSPKKRIDSPMDTKTLSSHAILPKQDNEAEESPSEEIEPHKNTKKSEDSTKILIAKQSILSSKILSKVIDTLDYNYKIVADKTEFEHYIGNNEYNLVFTDEEFIDTDNLDAIKKWGASFVFTTKLSNSDISNSIKHYRVDSLLLSDGVSDIIKKVGENR